MKKALSAFAIAAVMATPLAAQNLPLNNAVAGAQGDIVAGEGAVRVDGLVGLPTIYFGFFAVGAALASIILIADQGSSVSTTN